MAYLATYGGPRSERRFSEAADVSLWSPLRQTVFLGLFVAAFASNVGTWIQNVAAAWLMTLLEPSAIMVGLVQTLSGPLYCWSGSSRSICRRCQCRSGAAPLICSL